MYQTFNTLKLKNKSKKNMSKLRPTATAKYTFKTFLQIHFLFFFGLDLNFKSQNFLNT